MSHREPLDEQEPTIGKLVVDAFDDFGTLVRHINTPAAFWGYGVGSMVVGGLLLWLWFRRSGFLED